MVKALGVKNGCPLGFKLVLNFNHISGNYASVFYYYFITVSLISIKPQKFEVQYVGYPLAAAYYTWYALYVQQHINIIFVIHHL